MSKKDLLSHVVDEEEQKRLQKEHEEDMENIKEEFDKKNNKRYILMYTMAEDEEERRWMPFIGRDSLIEFIKTVVDELDIHNSFVLVDAVTLEKSLSLYKFMKAMEEYYDDGFDIEDYN